MAGDAFEHQVLALEDARQQPLGDRHLEAELGVVQAGGDVGMGLGIDVRVDAERDLRGRLQARRDPLDRLDLLGALDVDGADRRAKGRLDLLVAFADAAEDDAAAGDPGFEAA